jgi:hypothetical protein
MTGQRFLRLVTMILFFHGRAPNRESVVGAGSVMTRDVLLFLDEDIQIGRDFVTPDDAEIGWIRFPKNYGKRCITS